ncbi:MAG TPA: C40 family peptidase [Alphaproteobacteria bacterium]|jgi:cell wall-associated NlpC family hydrolase|nr:C40 family peptidase [Alphaproteobacteria bacterium]
MTATRMRIAAPSAFLRKRPDDRAEALTELLFGEEVMVMFSRADWAEIESLTDGYKGFMHAAALGESGPAPTHLVTALRTLAYPEPNLRSPPIGGLSFMSRTHTADEHNGFAELAPGIWVPASHLSPIGTTEPNYLMTAKRFLEVPYLWGGRTAQGLDCSALVQLSLAAAGITVPRDSAPQRASVGQRVLGDAPPRAGDLVFWPGHVAFAIEDGKIVHANAHHMAVAIEPLAEMVQRVGAPVEVRRLG